MPGVVNMENGNQAGVSGTRSGNTNIAALKDQAQDVVQETLHGGGGHTMTLPIRSNDLPPDIVHITEGFIPLSRIITRLAQMTHNQLSDKIRQIAMMPMPPTHLLNGTANGANRDEFDQSNESVARKVALNKTMQMLHGKWVKLLVIADWSRQSKDVSKLIDLRTHLLQLQQQYEERLVQMMEVKRQLSFARVPSPDLKTALHVLSTGDGSFMPDFQYIEPKPMTDDELAKWVEDLNTTLSIRLNLDDYDNIPIHFRNYQIKNGRAIFRVQGEFEVELTIADDDSSKQFWFVDFRFKCSPAPREISTGLRQHLEVIVNDIISRDNLMGCFNFLHEFVLTYKINELKHQAIELGRTSWSAALSMETLDRAIAIQYWPKRLGPNGSKHWVIVAVDSQQKATGWKNPKTTSKLCATWFRDGKPVKNESIHFDTTNLCCEDLIRTVIGKHIEYILKSMYKSLISYQRYNSGKAALSVHIDTQKPAKSSLTMQCSQAEFITMHIEPATGEFKLDSHSKQSLHAENSLNNSLDPAHDGARLLGNIRYSFLVDECTRKIRGTGWISFKSLAKDDVKAHLQIRDPTFWHFCFQRKEMMPNWLLVCLIRPEGDEWYLCKVNPPSISISSHRFAGQRPIKVDIDALKPDLTARFWNDLTRFIHDKMSELTEDTGFDRTMSTASLKRRATANPLAPSSRPISNNTLSLHEIVPGSSLLLDSANIKTAGTQSVAAATQSGPARTPWAHDTVTLIFNGVTPVDPFTGTRTPMWISSCIVRVLDKSKFKVLGRNMARDIRYNGRTGEFCIRIQRPVGHPLRPLLKPRLEAIDRVVNFLDAMNKAGPSVRCESVALQRVAFTYTSTCARLEKTPAAELAGHTWTVTFDLTQPSKIVPLLHERDPHQMVGGMLTRLANEPNGLHTLVRTLPRTLPLMEAISEVVATSPQKMDQGKGAVRALHLSAGASCLIYHLSSGYPVRLDIRARIRNGSIWWVLERVAMNGHSLAVQPEEADEGVLNRLKLLFSTPEEEARWTALGTGLTTQGVKHIRAMILAADQQVWGP